MDFYTMAYIAWDIHDPTCEAYVFVGFFFITSIAALVLYFLKWQECEKSHDNEDVLEQTIKDLETKLMEKAERETEILENFGKKIDILSKENDKYKDADEYSKIFIDKTVVPIRVTEVVDMTEGAYAYFVDEDKKREFALHSSKREIIKELVDILIDGEYIWWENVYDDKAAKHTVTGKLMILADKKE